MDVIATRFCGWCGEKIAHGERIAWVHDADMPDASPYLSHIRCVSERNKPLADENEENSTHGHE